MTKTAIAETAAKGSALAVTSSREILDIPEATNRFSPSGGVENPMDKQQIITMPKCTGSIPKL